MSISKKSVWYKLAHQYADYYPHNDTNSCEFVRAVLVGILLVVVIIALGACFVVGLVLPIVWGAVVLFTGQYDAPGELTVTLGISMWGIVFIFGGAIAHHKLTAWWKTHKPSPKQPYTPPFIVVVYQSFKDKVCHKITFTD